MNSRWIQAPLTLALVVGCTASTDDGADTELDSAATSDTDATSTNTDTSSDTSSETGPDESAPTYYQDVAPILSARCVSCHQDDAIAPLSLTTYEQARDWSALMATAVESRIMPPFLVDASGGCGEFFDSQWLDEAEIETIVAWAEAGAPEGEIAEVPPPPEPPALDRVDLTIEMPEPYTPQQDLIDDYRCFLIDPQLAEDRYLSGYDLHPGNPNIVHHVQMFALDTDAQEMMAQALDDAEPGPGFTCLGNPTIGDLTTLAFWAPGSGAIEYPEAAAPKLSAGHRILIEVHYYNDQTGVPDQTSIDLRLQDQATLAQMAGIEHRDMVLPPGEAYYETTYDMLIPEEIIPIPVKIYAVGPHMHTLGRTLRVELQRVGETEPTCVLDVPRWDFAWQRLYFPNPPIDVGPGDTVSITCGYDTTSRDEDTVWGEGTDDEMCAAYALISF